MTQIFEVFNISKNDPLREKKINVLNSIKDCLQGIDKKIELEILEKRLPEIILAYSNSHQREDLTLRDLTSKYRDFENDWHKKLINATEVKEINNIQGVVNKAILKYGKYITKGLI